MKEFNTAVEEVTDEGKADADVLKFMIDGREITSYRPGPGQIAMLLTSVNKFSDSNTRLAGIINFLYGTLDEDSQEYLVGRLLDRNDPFGRSLDKVEEILEHITEEWTSRPTQPPAASTS